MIVYFKCRFIYPNCRFIYIKCKIVYRNCMLSYLNCTFSYLNCRFIYLKCMIVYVNCTIGYLNCTFSLPQTAWLCTSSVGRYIVVGTKKKPSKMLQLTAVILFYILISTFNFHVLLANTEGADPTPPPGIQKFSKRKKFSPPQREWGKSLYPSNGMRKKMFTPHPPNWLRQRLVTQTAVLVLPRLHDCLPQLHV